MLYVEDEVFLMYPDAVRTFTHTSTEFSTHFGGLIKVSTGTPFSSVRYPPPMITLILEVVALIALSETKRFLKSGRITLAKSVRVIVVELL